MPNLDRDHYKSEIRDSEIRDLEQRVSKGAYSKYLRRIILKRVRSFADREVTLDFPVTALIGPNGGGKSTILGAAGLVYKAVPPRRFFAKSGKYDASMKDWTIEYEIIDRSISHRLSTSRTASYKELRWKRNAVDRSVLIFGVNRTVPATERPELAKAVGNKFLASAEVELEPSVVDAVEKILGKPIEGYNKLFVDKDERVSLFAAKTSGGDAYSEFHFGAGEASVIHIVAGIEAAEEHSLILIEEIENGLHPVATRRMVEYLIDVASRKHCQVIFTTHSNDALAPLPPAGIWAAYNSEVLQGKLDVAALRTITGQIEAQLAIFVEDEFAEQLVTTAIRHHGEIELGAVKIHGMGGVEPAIIVNEQHNIDPTAQFPSICLVDGDQRDRINHEGRVFSLPGEVSPEAYIFDRVVDRIDSVAALLTVSMQLPSSQQDRVKRVVCDIARTNRDRHVIYQQIGDALDFTSRYVVVNAFLAVWAQQYPEELASFVEQFAHLAPRRGR